MQLHVYLKGSGSSSALSKARDIRLSRVMPDTMFSRNPPGVFA
jgi:hypothetical protein